MLGAILESAAAKKAMDIFGDNVLGKWKRRRGAHEALELSRNRILSVRIANNFYPELTRLREIFIRHGLAHNNNDNCRFFETWLSHPAVEVGWTPSGGWTAAKIEALCSDLAKIRA